MDPVGNPRVSKPAMHNLSWIGLAIRQAGQGSPVQLRSACDISGMLPEIPAMRGEGEAPLPMHDAIYGRTGTEHDVGTER